MKIAFPPLSCAYDMTNGEAGGTTFPLLSSVIVIKFIFAGGRLADGSSKQAGYEEENIFRSPDANFLADAQSYKNLLEDVKDTKKMPENSIAN
jgi:hypothetical protein